MPNEIYRGSFGFEAFWTVDNVKDERTYEPNVPERFNDYKLSLKLKKGHSELVDV